ncbi:MAG: LPS assembly lipoprotein LptE [Opitutaceae bacterium]|nr:LPS assembly lipoprotein LptE [Opitutaceae bacterium]
MLQQGALWIGLLILAGCSHYKLGTGAPRSFSTLYIPPVVARALLPQAAALVSTQVREAFLRDGRVTVVNSADAADATLQIDLERYDRETAVARSDDTGLARKLDVRLYASCTLLDLRSRQTLFTRRPVVATRGVFADSGQLQAEYQALPLLAQDLSGQIVHAVLDTW